ncbi:hypothetical protein CS8_013320 [Cupriavidus sp. 8B]
MMISIGGVYRGPELRGSEINRTLMAVTRALNELRGPVKLGELPLVNAVFVVPGSLGDAGFSGLQFGDFSKKDKAVVVQIAVPPELTTGPNQVSFIVNALHGANAMAFEFFRQRGEQFSLREAEELVSAISAKL